MRKTTIKCTPHTQRRAHIGLGNVFFRLGDYARAREAFRYTIKLEPEDARAYWNLGQTERALGNDAGAEKNYLKALEIQPDLPEVRRALESIRGRSQG